MGMERTCGKSKSTDLSRCLNCKTKRRKCDEVKPTCSRCSNRGDKCEWGSRLTFRAENALGLGDGHPSLQQKAKQAGPPTRFKIKDVTAEIIRDHQDYDPLDGMSTQSDDLLAMEQSPPTTDEHGLQYQGSPLWPKRTGLDEVTLGFPPVEQQSDNVSLQRSETVSSTIPIDLSLPVDLGSVWESPIASGYIDDSLFLPGSAYLDAYSTFRDHLMYEVRSGVPTRDGTPNPPHEGIHGRVVLPVPPGEGKAHKYFPFRQRKLNPLLLNFSRHPLIN